MAWGVGSDEDVAGLPNMFQEQFGSWDRDFCAIGGQVDAVLPSFEGSEGCRSFLAGSEEGDALGLHFADEEGQQSVEKLAEGGLVNERASGLQVKLGSVDLGCLAVEEGVFESQVAGIGI